MGVAVLGAGTKDTCAEDVPEELVDFWSGVRLLRSINQFSAVLCPSCSDIEQDLRLFQATTGENPQSRPTGDDATQNPRGTARFFLGAGRADLSALSEIPSHWRWLRTLASPAAYYYRGRMVAIVAPHHRPRFLGWRRRSTFLPSRC